MDVQPAAAADSPEKWDQATDVVCVGSGAAGCSAAVFAADHGAKVILLEKAPILGGTTLKSGGVAWVPNNPVMRAKGFQDPKEDAVKYMCRFSFPESYRADHPTLGLDPMAYRKIEALYDNGGPMVDRLKELGIVEFLLFAQNDKPPADYADHLPENKAPHGRALVLGENGQAIHGGIGDGLKLISKLEAYLRSKNMPVLTEHRVTRLVMENGRVVGVEADSGGKTVRIRANKAVIFGTGGFAHNLDFIQLYQKFLYGSCAQGGAVGDFVTIASRIGAQIANMQSAWRTQVVLEQALENRIVGAGAFFLPADSMVMVDGRGKRVVNEKRDYNDRTKVHYTYDPTSESYPNQFLYMIWDSRSMDAFGGDFPIPADPRSVKYLIEGADLAALSAAIQQRLTALEPKLGPVALDPGFAESLKATVARFNEFAKKGVDEDFHRGKQAYDRDWQVFFSAMREGTKQPKNPMPNETMHPLADKGPYYAVILAAGALDTNGGPMTNEKAQVLDADGKVIPGLYGAGNCIASPTREAYYGAGGTIGPGMTYGYIAGMNAAKEGEHA
ncbi:MAG TPA: FAD-dependent oxidoreductase [Stellaceae bacterium]|nr:FAD-dependent oxidoreductase [Stellaceae bacterium]